MVGEDQDGDAMRTHNGVFSEYSDTKSCHSTSQG